MREYTLELARGADAPHIAAMSQGLIETGLRPSWPASRVTWHIRHPESLVLTAKLDHEFAGFAIMQYADASAHLNLLAVAPEHQRRGVARRLLGWLEETAVTAGTFLVGLELRATNVQAHAFYTALGYREAGRVNGYYQGKEHAIRMVHDLRTGQGALRA